MLQLKVVNVDGSNYQLSQMGSDLAERLLIRIFKIIGEPAAILFASISKDGQGLDADINPNLASLMMRQLVSGVDEDLIVNTVNQLYPYIKVGAGKDQYVDISPDVHFSGKMKTKYKVIGELLKHNYNDFLEDAESVKSVFLAKGNPNTTSEK